MQLLADVMLTNVGRWMRIIGIKTFIAKKDMSDDEILYEARKRKAILLTEDRELSKRAKNLGMNVIFIDPKITNLKEKLISVLKKCKINKTRIKNFEEYTLCTKCGGNLKKVNTKMISDKDTVPSYILERYDEIWICKDCGKVYWEGSHWKKIRSFLNEIINELEREKE
jgi:uncharacterized protein with PIN domain